MTEFENTGLEIVKFMRGKYRLDEVAGMYYEIPVLWKRVSHTKLIG